jgi:tetratricopeptide (TPR) repeat protein
VVFAGIVFLGIIETGVVNVMAMQAQRYDDRVSIPPQVVFTSNGILPPQEMVLDAERAIEYYDLAGYVGDGGWSLIPSERSEFALRKAWLLAVLRRFDEAIVLFDEVIARNGFDEDLAMGRGRLLLSSDPEDIDAWYGTVLQEYPTWSHLRDDRIRMRVDRGEYRGAISEARTGYAANPDDLLAMRRLAVVLLDYGTPLEWSESEKITTRTLEIEPENAYAWRALALAQAKLGDLATAQVAMEKAVEFAPQDYLLRSHYVRLLNDRGFLNHARAQHLEALRLWEEQGGVGDQPQMPEPPPTGPIAP